MSFLHCNKFTVNSANYDIKDNVEELMDIMANLCLYVAEANICRHFEIVASSTTAIFYETIYNLYCCIEELYILLPSNWRKRK